jgi:hypothetical protein
MDAAERVLQIAGDLMTRTLCFWTLWLLGTLAMMFVWLFGHVPAASGLILVIGNALAICFLGCSLLLERRIWTTAEASDPSRPTYAGLKLIYVIAGLQCLTSAYWILDVVLYELRRA